VQSQKAASPPTCTRFDHSNLPQKMYRNSRAIDQHTGTIFRSIECDEKTLTDFYACSGCLPGRPASMNLTCHIKACCRGRGERKDHLLQRSSHDVCYLRHWKVIDCDGVAGYASTGCQVYMGIGMVSLLRKSLCCGLIALSAFPISLLADEPKAAMLYARGDIWVNGAAIPRSTAIFAGDLIQTKANSAANINLPGANATVLPDSLVKFAGKTIELEHGGLTLLTANQMTAEIGDVKVQPASTDWSEFWVGDVDGNVTIMARKGDLTVTDETGTSTLSAGQETTREESQIKKKKKGAGGAVPAATGGIMDSKAALIAGIAAVGGITTIVLLQREDPISPSRMGR